MNLITTTRVISVLALTLGSLGFMQQTEARVLLGTPTVQAARIVLGTPTILELLCTLQPVQSGSQDTLQSSLCQTLSTEEPTLAPQLCPATERLLSSEDACSGDSFVSDCIAALSESLVSCH